MLSDDKVVHLPLNAETTASVRLHPKKVFRSQDALELDLLMKYNGICSIIDAARESGEGYVIWIGVNGRVVTFSHDGEVPMEKIKPVIGLNPEDLLELTMVDIDHRKVQMVFDEEGKLKKAEPNLLATFLYNGTTDVPQDVIVGEAVLLIGKAEWT